MLNIMEYNNFPEENAPKKRLWLYAIGAGVVLFLVIVLFFVFFSDKKKQNSFANNTQNSSEEKESVSEKNTQTQQTDYFVSVKLRDVPRQDPLPEDADKDSLADVEEEKIGTKKDVFDTDGDGISDGSEVLLQTNPLLSDTDGDGYSDGWEMLQGYSPTSTK